MTSPKSILRASFLGCLALASISASAIDASDRYRSPRNPERAIRRTTELIVLHTTEAAAKGSLKKLSDRGECHYCITEDGQIYRIIDRDREAFHAGRSMWNGKEDVDKFSIGIECVGYHDKAMSLVQLYAIRDLVRELKSMYHLSDDKVVCHSHVAYGAPNKWHAQRHRGRKQCGMLFAMPSVRRVLELTARPAYDADVRAKRLVNGDDYLAKVLYGNTDTMRGTYARNPTTPPPPPPDKSILGWLGLGDDEKIAATPPPQPKPSPRVTNPKPKTTAASRPKATAATSQGAASSRKTQTPKSGHPQGIKRIPSSIAELKKQGYVLKGTVSPYNTASRIARGRWNSPDTYYTIRNKVIPGNLINPAKIEKGMCIWMK